MQLCTFCPPCFVIPIKMLNMQENCRKTEETIPLHCISTQKNFWCKLNKLRQIYLKSGKPLKILKVTKEEPYLD